MTQTANQLAENSAGEALLVEPAVRRNCDAPEITHPTKERQGFRRFLRRSSEEATGKNSLMNLNPALTLRE